MSQTKNADAFKVIYEACEEGILAVSLEGEIKIANKSAHQIFGYEKGKMQGLTIESLIPKNLRESHVKDRKNYSKQPTPRRMGAGRELLGLRKNGEHFPVEVSLNKARLNDADHVIAYIIDISERKKIEKALKRSEEQLILYASQLEKRVKDRTDELLKTNKQLEKQIAVTKQAEEDAKNALEREKELNELKSRFVSMASHEFRTPLSTILSSTSLIEKYNDREDGKIKAAKHLTKIKSSIGNLNGILDDFLSLSRLEEGRIDINSVPVSISEVCKSAIDELSSVLKNNQKINFKQTGKEFIINTDPKVVKNVFINLLSNAIKYSEKDIEFILKCDPDSIKIEVRDQGMGIPKEDQKHLFERFFRAKNAMNIQGTGLGLNIVKKYIEMLNGDISFTSEANKGTTFNISIPKS